MKVDVHIEYTEQWIPPRCRKPRGRRVGDVVTVELAEVAADQAPVAFRWADREWVDRRYVDVTVELRWWDGRLWRRAADRDGADRQTPADIAASAEAGNWPVRGGIYGNREQVERTVRDAADRLLFVDGQKWESVRGEPYYEVASATALASGDDVSWVNVEVGDPRADTRTRFRADQLDLATAAALAAGRFDKSESRAIEVLIPDAVRADDGTARAALDARYRELVDQRNALDAEIRRLRAELDG